MADGILLNAGSGGATLAADDITGTHWQIVKLSFGALDTGTLVTSSAGLPVAQQGTWTVGLSAGTATNEMVGDVAQDAAVGGNPVLIGGRASAAAPTDMSTDGDSVYLWTTLKGALNVADAGGSLTVDNAGTFAVQATLQASTATTEVVGDAAHDAVAAGNPLLMGGYAKAAAPADVSADADAVNAWFLRNGAQATVLTAAGALIGGDAANGIDVDVTRVTGTVTIAGAVTNAGTFVVQENGSALTALQKIDDPVLVDDAAFSPTTSSVMMAGFQADETATDSIDEGDAGAARMTLDRKVIVTVQPHTTGGWDVKMCSSADGSTALTNSSQVVKGSAGKLGGYFIYNPNATAQFVLIYNVASASVTVGTTNPLMMLTIPATAGANVEFVNGVTFDTAIAVAAASTAGGNGAPTTALDCVFLYK